MLDHIPLSQFHHYPQREQQVPCRLYRKSKISVIARRLQAEVAISLFNTLPANEIATVAALPGNDNFRVLVRRSPHRGRMIAEGARLLQMYFFVIARRPKVDVVISSSLNPSDCEIATVTALPGNDNFRVLVRRSPHCGRMIAEGARLLLMSFFV
ncbi:MAG: hypothetical protein R3179_09500, partial [Sedimenticolaceae bacterium]|nr:hypothetical protein [Sedimenticolaceae bacterium]